MLDRLVVLLAGAAASIALLSAGDVRERQSGAHVARMAAMEAQGVALGRAIARSDEGAVEASAVQLVRLLDEERSLWRGQGLDVAIGLAEGDHAAAARLARDAALGDLSRAAAARAALARSCSACHAAYDVSASGIQ